MGDGDGSGGEVISHGCLGDRCGDQDSDVMMVVVIVVVMVVEG